MFLKNLPRMPPAIYGALTCAFSIFITLFVLAASNDGVAIISI